MNVFDDIQFYVFNHHHYVDVPEDHESIDSTWVDIPNRLFDPVPGAETRTLPGVGHLMFDESREAVDAVADFVGEELRV